MQFQIMFCFETMIDVRLISIFIILTSNIRKINMNPNIEFQPNVTSYRMMLRMLRMNYLRLFKSNLRYLR